MVRPRFGYVKTFWVLRLFGFSEEVPMTVGIVAERQSDDATHSHIHTHTRARRREEKRGERAHYLTHPIPEGIGCTHDSHNEVAKLHSLNVVVENSTFTERENTGKNT